MLGGIMDISEQKQIEERLRETEGELRALTARLQSISESERQRIAREIHDELGQLLTGIKFDLSWIENRIEKLDNAPAVNPILDRVVEANELADESIKAVQRIASDLRPGVLDSLGLISALKYEAGRFRDRTGIGFELRVNDESAPVPINVSVAAFRIFQEALTNVARHANATRIEIDLNVNEDHLDLEICDNGRGIDSKRLNNRTSIGLLGMKERAMAHGGEVSIEPRRQGGTRVKLALPFTGEFIRPAESLAWNDRCVSLS
jgi:signal transduction histidine kinase